MVFSFQDLKQKYNIGSKFHVHLFLAYSFENRKNWLNPWLFSLDKSVTCLATRLYTYIFISSNKPIYHDIYFLQLFLS